MSKRKLPDYVKDEVYAPFIPQSQSLDPGTLQISMLRRMYQRVLMELSANRFKWTGMPDEIDTRYLETTLLTNALAVFYYDLEFDRYFALRGTGVGGPNMYNNPTEFIVYGNTMVNKTISGKNCVPIWANYYRQPDTDIINVYANRLAEVDRTVEIDMIHMRSPVLITADPNDRLSVLNAYKDLAEGKAAIAEVSSITGVQGLSSAISAINTGVDKDYVERAMQVKVRTWNEALTLLGIMNVNSEKRERMVVEEASGASGQVLGMRAIALNSRERAAEWINAKYGLNVSVEWNLDENSNATDLQALNPLTDMGMPSAGAMEGAENG